MGGFRPPVAATFNFSVHSVLPIFLHSKDDGKPERVPHKIQVF